MNMQNKEYLVELITKLATTSFSAGYRSELPECEELTVKCLALMDKIVEIIKKDKL